MIWWKRFKGEALVETFNPLDARRLPDGTRLLLGDFRFRITFPDGEVFEDTIPKDTVSDWSSWPNWAHIPIILPRPREEAMDVAGWIHDWVTTLVRERMVDEGYFWTVKFWRYVARSGQGVTRVRWYPSWLGAVGLTGWACWKTAVRYLVQSVG